ncbi:hypothetical protein R1sor_002044 [Riccia sorocarpa]|uniref:Reverse transcriptase domain-containing protein n=1 Tax=Riccia sorocarpa TaxID=122646 RepID=A0ABD3H0S2_9MARC
MSESNNVEQTNSAAAVDLISQLKKLSVASEESIKSAVYVKKNISAVKFFHKLEQVGLYSYCFEGSASLEAFRGWVASNWVRERRIKIVSTRPVGPSASLQSATPKKKGTELWTLASLPLDPRSSCTFIGSLSSMTLILSLRRSPRQSKSSVSPRGEEILLRKFLKQSPLFCGFPQLPISYQSRIPGRRFSGIHQRKHQGLQLLTSRRTVELVGFNCPSVFQTSPRLHKKTRNLQRPNLGDLPKRSFIGTAPSSGNATSSKSSSRPTSAKIPQTGREKESSVQTESRDASCQGFNEQAIVLFSAENRGKFFGAPGGGEGSWFSGPPGWDPSPIIEEITDLEQPATERKRQGKFKKTVRDILASRRKADARNSSGGVALLIRNSCTIKRWKAVNYRVIWADLEINGVSVPLVNMYVPVEPDRRRVFWEEIQRLLPAKKFFFAADWNMVEHPADSSTKSNWLTHSETVGFFNFKSRYHIQDVRECGCVSYGPRFTRAQSRDGKFCWSTLDKFYAPLSLLGGLQLDLVHHPDFPLSDHLPVSLLFSGQRRSQADNARSTYFNVDPRVLDDKDLRNKIDEIWQKHKGNGTLNTPEKYLNAWRELRSAVKDAQYLESQQLSTLDSKKKELRELASNADKSGEELDRYATLADQVRKLQSLHDHKIRLWSREKYLKQGETCSGYFLKKFKGKSFQAKIHSIKLDNGQVVRSQNDIVREVHRFYSNLYVMPVETGQIKADRERLLNLLQPVVSSGEGAFLTEVPSHREFTDILNTAPKGKAPGMDGFGYEAFLKIWGKIGEDYTALMANCWNTGEFPSCFLEGVIKLLPKDPRPESLHQWRPIALLSVHYKLLAKVIAARLAILLPNIVPTQQQGFIRGRGTHNCILNLLLANDSLKRVRRQGAFLMLDLEKAYDRLSLEFLWGVLDRLGFGEKFITILQSFSTGAVARVQQGISEGNMKAIKLADDITLDVLALADDTAIYLALHEESFQHLFGILAAFQSASGASVNWRKTKLMLLGKYTKPPDWLARFPFSVLGRSQTAKYLGVPVATVPRAQDSWAHIIAAVGKKVQALLLHRLSFEGRCVVLRFLVQTKLSYMLSFIHLTKSQDRVIRQIFRSLLWGTSHNGMLKTPLVAWEFLTAHGMDGGVGVCDLQLQGTAFLTKWVGNLLSHPPDTTWPALFSSMCRSLTGSSHAEALLLTDLHVAGYSPMFKKMLSAWGTLRRFLVWNQDVTGVPGSLSYSAGLLLLKKAGQISSEEEREGLRLGRRLNCRRWLDFQILHVLGDAGDAPIISKLLQFPALNSQFSFIPSDWAWDSPDGSTRRVFPILVSSSYSILSSDSSANRFKRLNSIWGLDWSAYEWMPMFKLIWLKGIPRRDSIFLWRLMFNGFFTGSMAARFGHENVHCRECGSTMEDCWHATASCPGRVQLWRTLGCRVNLFADPADRICSGSSLPLILWGLIPYRPHEKLVALLILVHGSRAAWRRRCELLFEDSTKELSWGSTIITVLEILLVDAKDASKARRVSLAKAMGLLLHCFPSPPDRFVKILEALIKATT